MSLGLGLLFSGGCSSIPQGVPGFKAATHAKSKPCRLTTDTGQRGNSALLSRECFPADHDHHGSGEQGEMRIDLRDEPFTNLYVKCFPSHFKEQDLCELFDGFGPIQAAKIMTDQRGRHFGFVNFEQPNDAKECVKMMHCKDLRTRKEQREAKKLEAEGKAPPVKLDVDGHPEHLLYVSRAQKKEEREAMFQKQLAEKGLLKGAAKGKGKGDGNPRDPRDLRDPRDRDPRDLRDPRDPRDRDPRDSFGKGGVQSLQSIPMATLPRPVHTPSTLVSDVPSSSGNWSTPLYSQFGNGSSYTNGTSHLSSAGYTNGNGNAGTEDATEDGIFPNLSSKSPPRGWMGVEGGLMGDEIQEGYSIADDVPFSRLLDHATDEERPYKSRKGERKTVLHWGQRKLILAEIEFLTLYYERASWYAGAAPGTHIAFLAKMFPKLHFDLIDCRPFSRKLEEEAKELQDGQGEVRIRMRQELFTEELAKEYAKKEGVLFISDVRASKDDEFHPSVLERQLGWSWRFRGCQEAVEEDMKLQMSWHLQIKPLASSFKFRLPWGPGSTEYLKGRIYLPVWGPETTTESRLFVEGGLASLFRR
eukprot:s1336_g6.t1